MVSGQLGQPRFFRATSRDKERTSLEYATNSGGLIMDMAVHDLDLARYFMGDAEVVDVIGGRLFYPELESIPDIDTAIITLQFKSGALGVIDVSRRAAYGYDIATEIVGFRGAIRVDSLKRTATTVLTNNAVTHDTYPSFMERFETAFIRQLQNFVTNLIVNVPSPVTLEDAIAALKLGYDATYKLRVL
jgi:predicted dehydrogenase